MKPLETVYWLRFGFGIIAALAGLGLGLATGTIVDTPPFPTTALLNSASIAIIVYVLSYYLLKIVFAPRVQKPQKLVTTGIGIYFLSWIVFLILFYTIFAG